jgi:hypothetical protein
MNDPEHFPLRILSAKQTTVHHDEKVSRISLLENFQFIRNEVEKNKGPLKTIFATDKNG